MDESEIVFAPDLPPGIAATAPTAEAFAALTDVYATLRLNANRLLLFNLFRQTAQDVELEAVATRGAERAIRGMRAVMHLAFHDHGLDDVHPEAGAWFRSVLSEVPALADTLEEWCRMGEAALAVDPSDPILSDLNHDSVRFGILRLNTDMEKAERILAARQQDRRQALVGELIAASRSIGDSVGTMQKASNLARTISVNARIEAARAGEFGAGFAVISSEITAATTQTLEASLAAREGTRMLLSRLGSGEDRSGSAADRFASVRPRP